MAERLKSTQGLLAGDELTTVEGTGKYILVAVFGEEYFLAYQKGFPSMAVVLHVGVFRTPEKVGAKEGTFYHHSDGRMFVGLGGKVHQVYNKGNDFDSVVYQERK